jgi:hypothetical protein
MTTQLRSTTNLVVPEHLQLPKKELKSKFLYVYSAAYPGLEPVFMQRLWLSAFFPEITNDPSFGKDRKGVRQFVQFAEKYMKAGLIKIKKVNDPGDQHFVVAVPLAEFSRYDVADYVRKLRLWFTNGKGDEPEAATNAIAEELKRSSEANEVQQKQIMASEVIPRLNLDARGQLELKECFFGLRLQYSGGLAVVFADFKISKAEAQQLTTTEWMLIRNIDMYPLLLQWQVSLWGYRHNAPVTSFPMSKISKTLPPVLPGQARVNEYGLSIAPDGAPMWLPEKLDNTTRYEDLYAQIGDRGDDTFGLIDMVSAGTAVATGQELKVKLPANIPVLIDWVNNRFAYTMGNGVLKVQDLSRFKAADAAHARNLLSHWSLTDDHVKMFASMGETAGVKNALFFTEEEAKAIQENDPVVAGRLVISGGIEVMEYWDMAVSYHKRFVNEHKFVLSDVSIEGDPIWRPLARFIDQVQAAVIANMDAVNYKYSVSGTSSRLGLMTLISKYSNDLANTIAKANSLCAAAQNQRVDPTWTPPSIPLIMNNPDRPFSLLPHQVKVRNLLKDSPDFAILPVQAGGGKTPLAIIDVLTEIKANRSQPYLIMCPSALVAQYVKEVTYFTGGKVNVIPIVSDVLFRNGQERLTQMIASAPRNTVVVVNYDVLRNQAYDVCYGTTNVKVYPVIEFLRQFNFGYALLDESHFMKNDSQRTRAAMVLIADIPKKRLASGTMAHDSPSDLALQVAMLDPTLFGSRDEFNERFGKNVQGGRVIEWKPGAQQDIMRMIKSRIVVAKAMRKEWAALLPQAEEKIHPAEMTDAQRSVYQAILTEALDKMREDAKSNPKLKKFFENSPLMLERPQKDGDEGANEDADEEAEDVADESAGEDLESLLGFYLARIEQFLTAPGKDELGARVLQGADLRSNKVNKILEIVEKHIKDGIEGKVLIFTNYIESAEEIFDAASSELKKSGILYTAANKVEDGAAFETNANKKWMVGVENSMNTGLNFQHVSRLIRVENVWNPGTLEQGNSRINRPEMKKADRRKTIYYDWIVTNNSVDVTKVSRLISKIIAVAKFENTDNPAYEALPDVPVIPMNAESIEMRNSWSDLAEYAEAYRKHNQVKFDDYEEYRRKHGDLTLTPLREAPIPKDAALMAEVPYVAGLELFNGAEQGLIRVDEYLRQNASDEEVAAPEGDDDEAAAKSAEQKRRLELANSLKGQPVHTEFGDGIVKSVAFTSKLLNVLLPEGYMIRVRFSAAFVITKKAQKGKTIRQQILAAVSNKMPITEPVEAKSPRLRIDNAAVRRAEKQKEEQVKEEKKQQKTREVEAALNVELYFNVSNGFLSIVHYPEEGSEATSALQALGFRPVEPYVFAEVHNAQQLIKQFNAWHAKGFRFEKNFMKTGAVEAIRDLANVLKNGALKSGTINYRFSSRNQLQNFFRMEIKPSASKTDFKPYPMIEDGHAYIVMHLRGQPATQEAMKVKSPGIRWQKSATCYAYYGLNVDKISAKMREILASGIQVSNIKDLQTEFKKIKKMKIRNEEVGDQ